MRYRNDTSISDEKLMRIIQFADPDGLLEYGGEIIISNEADANDAGGHFEPHSTKDLEPRITIFTKDFEDDSDSDLVLSSAHEFRHMWQYYHYKDSIFSDKEKSEKDANNYPSKMLKLWLDDQWDWNSLHDYKKSLRMPLVEG